MGATYIWIGRDFDRKILSSGKEINLKKMEERGIFIEKPDICISPATNGDKREYNEKLKHNCGWLLIRKRQNRLKKDLRHSDAPVKRNRRILSAYFFGYWRTSDQDALGMSPFLLSGKQVKNDIIFT